MKLLNLIRAKKSSLEKIRILSYRLNKFYYLNKTKKFNLKLTTVKGISLSETLFLDKYLMDSAITSIKKIINEADAICQNEYRSISGKKIKVNTDKWNKDYIFDYEWKNKHYSKYILADEEENTDIKHVWELSRFYHLVILAQAYSMTQDEKYVSKILRDINSWEKQNPINFSVNWTVSMEVAIRAVNLIQTISLIKKSKLVTNKVLDNLTNIIIKHGIYISNNLEKGLNTNNHYLSNLVGLVWIGVFLKGTNNSGVNRLSEKWIDLALKQLKLELDYQVYDDGLSYEDSLSYHGLNTEMMLYTVIILENHGYDYSLTIRKTTHKMLDSFYKLLTNYEIPVFGDLDNGQLMISDINRIKNKLDFEFIFKISSYYKVFTPNKLNKNKLVIMKDSGFYRISKEELDLIFRCGQIGVNGLGSHTHNDQLSVVLNINKQSILIDSGTGYYSGDYKIRRQLRSTDSHNTISIEDNEQNNIQSLFSMESRTNSQIIKIKEDYVKGRHFGFYDKLGIIVTRSVEMKENEVIISDKVNKICENSIMSNFVLDTDIQILEKGTDHILFKKNNLVIEMSVRGAYLTVADQSVSKSYSSLLNTKKISAIFKDKESRTTFKVVNIN